MGTDQALIRPPKLHTGRDGSASRHRRRGVPGRQTRRHLAIAGRAAAASGAPGNYVVPSAACYLLGRLVLLLMYIRAWRHVPDARPPIGVYLATIGVYLATIGVSAALWAVSIGVDGTARLVLWGIGTAIGAAGPLLAGARRDRLPLQIEHLPERFGLLVILVLGETVGGAATGVHDASWAASAVAG